MPRPPRRPSLPMSWLQLLDALDQTDAAIRAVLVRDRLPRIVRAELDRIVRDVSGPALLRAGRR
jgi:hypothetical protein